MQKTPRFSPLFLCLLYLAIRCEQVSSFSVIPRTCYEKRQRSQKLPKNESSTSPPPKGEAVFPALLVSVFLGAALIFQPLPPVALAESSMACASTNCASSLRNCAGDRDCVRGLTCLLTCMTREDEGSCQVRCMDLHENDVMRDLTACTLTKHRCYPPLPADPKYSIVSPAIAVPKFDIRVFEGTWFVTAGWNRAFDCFDCQEHVFRLQDPTTMAATFRYRIQRGDGSFFTRVGHKTIRQVAAGGRLELKLQPDQMKYKDDWTVLTYEPNIYIVVHYHGTNAAWAGYGGLNVYTR
jgi:violaxanthin de-epoxidase